tara:strand:- start:325 stop:1266 length:942 start_codon:yes stop_codon:yes gene_type:complete
MLKQYKMIFKSILTKYSKHKMKNSNHKKIKIEKLILTALLLISIPPIQQPAIAFIPYIYETNTEDLKATSIKLAKTAAQLLHYGQFQEASRLIELAIRLNPKDSRLWSILAEVQVKKNSLNEASKSIAKAKELNPKNARLWFAEASLNLQQDNAKKAILLLQKGLSLEPKNANAYFQLGNARIMQSKLKLALRAFEKASTIKPDFWEALNNQGLVLFEIGKTQKAIDIWRKVLKIKENAEPMLALAAALNQVEKTSQEALILAKQALSQNPNYVSSKYQAEQLWGQKLQEATKQLFKDPDLDWDIERALTNSK